MGPDDKGVVNISEPEFGFEGGRLKCLLFEVFHVYVGYYWGERRSHRCAGSLPVEMFVEKEIGVLETFVSESG